MTPNTPAFTLSLAQDAQQVSRKSRKLPKNSFLGGICPLLRRRPLPRPKFGSRQDHWTFCYSENKPSKKRYSAIEKIAAVRLYEFQEFVRNERQRIREANYAAKMRASNSSNAQALEWDPWDLSSRLLFMVEVQFLLFLTELTGFIPYFQIAIAVLKIFTSTIEAIDTPEFLEFLGLSFAADHFIGHFHMTPEHSLLHHFGTSDQAALLKDPTLQKGLAGSGGLQAGLWDGAMRKVDAMNSVSLMKDPALLDRMFDKATTIMQVIDNIDNPEDLDAADAEKRNRAARNAALAAAIAAIRRDLEGGYQFSGKLSSELYSPDCYFTDGPLRFRGLDSFLLHVNRVKPLFNMRSLTIAVRDVTALEPVACAGSDSDRGPSLLPFPAPARPSGSHSDSDLDPDSDPDDVVPVMVVADWTASVRLQYPIPSSARRHVTGRTEYIIAVTSPGPKQKYITAATRDPAGSDSDLGAGPGPASDEPDPEEGRDGLGSREDEAVVVVTVAPGRNGPGYVARIVNHAEYWYGLSRDELLSPALQAAAGVF